MPQLFCPTTSRKKVQDIVLTFLVRTEKVVLIPRRQHFNHALLTDDAQAKEQYEPDASDFTIRSLLMTGPAHIFCFGRFIASTRAALGLFKWSAQRPILTWGLVWIFCTLPKSKKSTPLSFASFGDHSALAYLFSPKFPRFDRLVQLLVIVAHLSFHKFRKLFTYYSQMGRTGSEGWHTTRSITVTILAQGVFFEVTSN